MDPSRRFVTPSCLLCLLTLLVVLSSPYGLSQESPTFQLLYSFTGGTDGANPYAELLRDHAGNLYATTYGGGEITGQSCHCGVVFRLNDSRRETVLYTFTGDPDFGGPDGGFPQGDLTADKAGNLYGTTTAGGDPFYGVVFKIDQKGHYTVLHRFAGHDGSFPLGLVHDRIGNLYGVTVQSDEGNCCGTVYRIDSTGKESVLHFFAGSDGENPYGDLFLDRKGNIYGTTALGGSTGRGVVFKLNTTGQLKVLHNFTGGADDGGNPYGGLVSDGAGNGYGTTFFGGAFDKGVIYKIDRSGNFTVLYSFTGGADGGNPQAGLIRGAAGNLYGTTQVGGDNGCNGPDPGCGVVFKLDPSGTESVLHAFSDGTDGGAPAGTLTMDAHGNLYGTASGGGKGFGVVFKITP